MDEHENAHFTQQEVEEHILVVFHYVFSLNRVSLDNNKGNNAENYHEDVADDCED